MNPACTFVFVCVLLWVICCGACTGRLTPAQRVLFYSWWVIPALHLLNLVAHSSAPLHLLFHPRTFTALQFVSQAMPAQLSVFKKTESSSITCYRSFLEINRSIFIKHLSEKPLVYHGSLDCGDKPAVWGQLLPSYNFVTGHWNCYYYLDLSICFSDQLIK